MKKILVAVLFLSALAAAQAPAPQLPKVYIDTTWRQPTAGVTWSAHSSTDFQNALNASHPGDVIVLDAARVYSGNFTLPSKSNPGNLWIYVISTQQSKLPLPGTRINPTANAAYMPKIVTPNINPAINPLPGANHYRLAGLEITSTSTQGCNGNIVPLMNCYTYFLFGQPDGAMGHPTSLPDSITIDRCYLHGSPTQDVREGVQANVSNMAVIDSYISDIHQSTSDSQAIIAYFTPGPLKIVDNFLSATTEDMMFGGAGGATNPYIPSDIEIRQNHFYKPMAWAVPGITIPPHNQWVVKNNLEFKSARRVLVSGNVMENNWLSGQTGQSVLFTIRTSQSGNIAVVDDITVQNNILINVDAGFNTLASDNNCGAAYGFPSCTNPGESRRIKVVNNLVLMRSVANGSHHLGLQVAAGLTDFTFQHNTVLMSDQSTCWNSVYFGILAGQRWPLAQSDTHNVWILDNALCRQTTGDFAGQGTAGLTSYMSDPAPLTSRYLGNVMFVPVGDRVQTFPVHNYSSTVAFGYVAPASEDYQLSSPAWTDTSDGKIAGINWSTLYGALGLAERIGFEGRLWQRWASPGQPVQFTEVGGEAQVPWPGEGTAPVSLFAESICI
jgi:hypothetical protein